jgi:putative endonuclease
MNWLVYIILCSDNTLYAGITTDLQRRFAQHTSGRGAKYFRGRRPLEVVYQESSHTRSSAGRRELELKALTRPEKIILISSGMKGIDLQADTLPPLTPPTKSRRF